MFSSVVEVLGRPGFDALLTEPVLSNLFLKQSIVRCERLLAMLYKPVQALIYEKRYFLFITIQSIYTVFIHCLKRYLLQTQTGLGLRVYPFTTSGCCTVWIRCWQWCYKASIRFHHPKLSHLMLHGSQCIGHAVRTWFAVCSEVPHLQFDEGARPHLFMDK